MKNKAGRFDVLFDHVSSHHYIDLTAPDSLVRTVLIDAYRKSPPPGLSLEFIKALDGFRKANSKRRLAAAANYLNIRTFSKTHKEGE